MPSAPEVQNKMPLTVPHMSLTREREERVNIRNNCFVCTTACIHDYDDFSDPIYIFCQ